MGSEWMIGENDHLRRTVSVQVGDGELFGPDIHPRVVPDHLIELGEMPGHAAVGVKEGGVLGQDLVKGLGIAGIIRLLPGRGGAVIRGGLRLTGHQPAAG